MRALVDAVGDAVGDAPTSASRSCTVKCRYATAGCYVIVSLLADQQATAFGADRSRPEPTGAGRFFLVDVCRREEDDEWRVCGRYWSFPQTHARKHARSLRVEEYSTLAGSPSQAGGLLAECQGNKHDGSSMAVYDD